MKTRICTLLLILFAVCAFAQDDHLELRKGNKAYGKQNYAEAEKYFQQGLQKSPASLKSQFNLGDAYFKEKKFKEASGIFDKITKLKVNKDTLSAAYHNLGNSYLQQYLEDQKKAMPPAGMLHGSVPTAPDSSADQNVKTLQSAIDAYKEALIRKPTDEDTRSNLSYAYKYLKKEQNQQQQNKKNNKNKDKNKDKNQDKNKDQNKDQNKDNKKEDKDKDKKQNKNEDKNKQ